MAGEYEKYKVTRLAATGVVKAAPTNIWGILLTAPTNDADLKLYDDINSADGTVLFDVSALNGTSFWLDLKRMGGRGAAAGVWGVLTGTNAIAYIFHA